MFYIYAPAPVFCLLYIKVFFSSGSTVTDSDSNWIESDSDSVEVMWALKRVTVYWLEFFLTTFLFR